MKRIDPVDVARRFQRKNLVPAPGAFRGVLRPGEFRAHETPQGPGDTRCADGCGVLQREAGTSWTTLPDLPPGYLTGFKRGFDGDEPLVYGQLGQPEAVFVRGYLDGIEAHLETLKRLGFLVDQA